MPEFFSFTLGAETNPRVLRGPDEESPLLVGRFRAVVAQPPSGRTAGHGHSRRSSRASERPYQPHANRLRRQRWPSRWSQRWPAAGQRGYGAIPREEEAEEEEDDGYDEDDEDDDEEEEEEEEEENNDIDDDDDLAGTTADETRERDPTPPGKSVRRSAGGSAGRRRRARRGLVLAARRAARRTARHLRDVWLTPRPAAVRRAVSRWWSRWALLVVLPAALAVAWCAIPVPRWALDEDEDDGAGGHKHRLPAHGEARVRISFWFFLLAYYGPYNAAALLWITKVFNLYGLNWWAPSPGFAASAALLAATSLAVPAVLFVAAPNVVAALMTHNTAWVTWTFAVMAVPAAAALALLLLHERHLGRRQGLSATQRIFASTRAEPHGGRFPLPHAWLPASFVRFLWLMSALFVSLLVFELGEASASLFLAALPAMRHETAYAVVYVWGWTVTVFLLDALTGWILGGHQGERVGSYPLGWVFKLYFMLTYQTYVRALYARLRSPSQVVLLQVLSSTTLIVLTPLLMSPWMHRLLAVLGLNGMAYPAYQKVCVRNVFLRFVAQNATMLAFLAALLVLHLGPNRDVYPYFSFDDDNLDDGAPFAYTFSFTLYAASITWACELVAALLVSALILAFYGVAVVPEATADLATWPELLPASVAVTVHVLQNMLFSIIRLRF